MENEPNKEKCAENKAEPNMEKADVRRRTYNREYYHAHKAPVKCEFCGTEYSCKSGLIKHQKRSHKCMVSKLQKYMTHLGIYDKDIFTNFLTKVETVYRYSV